MADLSMSRLDLYSLMFRRMRSGLIARNKIFVFESMNAGMTIPLAKYSRTWGLCPKKTKSKSLRTESKRMSMLRRRIIGIICLRVTEDKPLVVFKTDY